MGKIQENDARLQQLVSMARIGWWRWTLMKEFTIVLSL